MRWGGGGGRGAWGYAVEMKGVGLNSDEDNPQVDLTEGVRI